MFCVEVKLRLSCNVSGITLENSDVAGRMPQISCSREKTGVEMTGAALTGTERTAAPYCSRSAPMDSTFGIITFFLTCRLCFLTHFFGTFCVKCRPKGVEHDGRSRHFVATN
uniref:Uncharacterized protein n=1 Tax=Romanomermis culicivorax TaxID=13658 RepID=A0A915L857_ROMCU